MPRHSSNRAPQRTRPPVKKYLKPSAPAESRSTRSKFWPWMVVAIVLVLIGLAGWYVIAARPSSQAAQTQLSQVQTTPTFTPTPTSIPASDWQTLKTFSGSTTGNGTKRTETFTISATWQITWACQGIKGVDKWLYIAIYRANGTLYNAGAQITCIAAKQVIGNTIEQASGSFYLTIDASTSWTVAVQTLEQ